MGWRSLKQYFPFMIVILFKLNKKNLDILVLLCLFQLRFSHLRCTDTRNTNPVHCSLQIRKGRLSILCERSLNAKGEQMGMRSCLATRRFRGHGTLNDGIFDPKNGVKTSLSPFWLFFSFLTELISFYFARFSPSCLCYSRGSVHVGLLTATLRKDKQGMCQSIRNRKCSRVALKKVEIQMFIRWHFSVMIIQLPLKQPWLSRWINTLMSVSKR